MLAKKLVGRFRADVLTVSEKRPAELQSADGIGPKRRERIAHAWQEARQVREIMLFLHSHGVSTSRAVRIFKTYGEQAIEKVRSNPYMLAKDIYGIGFATADQIAQKVGIPRDSLNRAKAGIDHVLLEATSDGHCALPLEKLKLAAVKLLEVQEAIVEQALSQMLTGGSLLLEEIDGEPLIFLPHLRGAEEGIAARIKSLAGAEPIYPPIDFEKAVAWCEQRTGKTLAPSEREALKTVLSNRVVVITGGPGVGKTTLVNSILMILRAKGVKCLLCAPTGRAAKRLTEVFRQAAGSRIITNAHRIRRGQMPDMRGADPSSDFHFVERDDPEKIVATLVKLVQERIPDRFRLDPIRDVQVLCPMNRGSLGVRELNTALQKVLNPTRPGQPTVERFGWRFQIGDKVIQTENDYDKDVFNGDVGIVERVDAVEQQVAVRFDDRLVKYDFGELDEISLAYAITIHKSQGSEFPAVVIPLATQHYMLLQRNLIYTGITRGKRLLVLVGQKKALGIAVRNDRPQRRYSGLLDSLQFQGDPTY